uniref:Retrotransposon Copia-like N-terminal domain-containing protein n=1 Tax=Cannabis sativa TaxID=3483 RepID=A0A803PSX4_CANSA
MVRMRANFSATSTDLNTNQVDDAHPNSAPPTSQNSADIPPRVPVPVVATHHVHGDQPTYEDVRSPYYLSTVDHPELALVTPILIDRNFQPWTRDFKLFIGARNKMPFLDVSPEIKSSIMYLDTADDTAAEMWTELNNRFNQGNGPRIFELNESLTFLHQGDDSVSTYFTKRTAIWDEIHQLHPKIPCTCVAAARTQEYHNHDQVLQFLKGLNESYHVVRDQVLLLDPCPQLNKVFSMIVH